MEYEKAQTTAVKHMQDLLKIQEAFRSEMNSLAQSQKQELEEIALTLKSCVKGVDVAMSNVKQFTNTIEEIEQLLESQNI